MPNVKLSYFNFPGGRGEDCRIALFMAGVDFIDDRVNGPDWPALKDSTPYGSMPVLEVDGKKLAQSNAILGFIGLQHDLLPADPFEAARHLAVLEAVEDLRNVLGPTLREKNPEKKKATRQAIAANDIPTWARRVQAQIGEGPFFGGQQISVADLKLYMVMKWLINGIVDHIPTTVFDDFPKLRGLYDAVESHPKVTEWYAR